MRLPSTETLRRLYDDQLRGDAEIGQASSSERAGPLWRTRFAGQGFVTYRSLDGVGGHELDQLIKDTVTYYRDVTECHEFEWKTRGHDLPADLPARLVAHGLEPKEVETVMIGAAEAMAVDVPLPDGVSVRRAGDGRDLHADLERACAMHGVVFGPGGPGPDVLAADIASNLDGLDLWLAESGGEVVGAGRLERVVGTDVAGLWGGGVLPEWRGKGIYWAITSARARAALAVGAALLQCDCSEMSRPILERNGFVAITTTTPYVWKRQVSPGEPGCPSGVGRAG